MVLLIFGCSEEVRLGLKHARCVFGRAIPLSTANYGNHDSSIYHSFWGDDKK